MGKLTVTLGDWAAFYLEKSQTNQPPPPTPGSREELWRKRSGWRGIYGIVIYNKKQLLFDPILGTELLKHLEFPVLREECCYIDEVTFGQPLGTKGMGPACQRDQPCDESVGIFGTWSIFKLRIRERGWRLNQWQWVNQSCPCNEASTNPKRMSLESFQVANTSIFRESGTWRGRGSSMPFPLYLTMCISSICPFLS